MMILTGVKQQLVSQRPFLPCGENNSFQSECKFAYSLTRVALVPMVQIGTNGFPWPPIQ
jgi:hypothetical protein